jgi:hypothetical protein
VVCDRINCVTFYEEALSAMRTPISLVPYERPLSTIWNPFGGGSVLRPMGFAASAGLGTLIGMRHAFEPDHLAALSTLLTGERNVRRAAWLGVYWGVGHTLTLLVAGTLGGNANGHADHRRRRSLVGGRVVTGGLWVSGDCALCRPDLAAHDAYPHALEHRLRLHLR